MNRSQEDTINSSSEFAANRKISQEESDNNAEKSLEDVNIYSDSFQAKVRLSFSSLYVIDEIDVNMLQERDKTRRTKLEDLEFCCNGQVLNRFQRVEEVEGCTTFLVRINNDI